MCWQTRLKLKHLHREQIGDITLAGIEKPNDFRFLSQEEVERLWANSGGMTEVYRNRVIAMAKHVQVCQKLNRTWRRLEEWFAKWHIEELLDPQLLSIFDNNSEEFE
jgi:hypothetical protein